MTSNVAKGVFCLSQEASDFWWITLSLSLLVSQRFKYPQQNLLNVIIPVITLFYFSNTLIYYTHTSAFLSTRTPLQFPQVPGVTALLPPTGLSRPHLPPVLGNLCPVICGGVSSRIPCQHLLSQAAGANFLVSTFQAGKEDCDGDLSTERLLEKCSWVEQLWEKKRQQRWYKKQGYGADTIYQQVQASCREPWSRDGSEQVEIRGLFLCSPALFCHWIQAATLLEGV